jgi:hypothetical protein
VSGDAWKACGGGKERRFYGEILDARTVTARAWKDSGSARGGDSAAPAHRSTTEISELAACSRPGAAARPGSS